MTNREQEGPRQNPFFDEVYGTLSDPELGDFEGFSDLAKVYRTKKEDKDPTLPQFVEAIGMVIEKEDLSSPGVQADAVHLAYHLDLWDLSKSVDKLKASPIYNTVDYVRHEVDTFSSLKKHHELEESSSLTQPSFDTFYTHNEKFQ